MVTIEIMVTERAIAFDCGDDTLVGIAHLTDNSSKDGVLVVVGGPQYRVGSHRQFVLVGRHLARYGIPTFRFDHRGIGDSSGTSRSFLTLDEDIRSAVDAFLTICPELQQIYIWGLCDAASAALMYVNRDPRIAGLILLNPWVRTEAGLAKALLKTYYLKSIGDPRMWKNLLTGRPNIARGITSFLANLFAAMASSTQVESNGNATNHKSTSNRTADTSGSSFPEKMLSELRNFKGPVLFILSGNDVTAEEFRNLVKSNWQWKKAVQRSSITWFELPESNHTFSTQQWRDRVAERTSEWVLNQ